MNLREYLLFSKSPLDLLRFADFREELKNKYKTLDGYAFDFGDREIRSIKLYYKIYSQKNIFNSNFFLWFTKDNLLSFNLRKFFKETELDSKSLSGLNFSIKYNLLSNQLIKSIYFSDRRKSSLVINESNQFIYFNRYYYLHNRLLIKLINKLFEMGMPNHNEAVEFSLRGKDAHCTVFPKIDKKKTNLMDSNIYCQKLMYKLLECDAPLGQNLPLCIHLNTSNSSLITKGYTAKNKFQKIYFGCFDWEKSIF